MEVATRALTIEATNDAKRVLFDFPGFDRTLEYVFDLPIQPGPELTRKVTFVPGQPLSKNQPLSDMQIAKAVLLRPSERYKAAPGAYQANGQIQPEYRQVLERLKQIVGATDAQITSASPHGYRMKEWVPEDKDEAARQRAEKLTTAHWEITFLAPVGYTPSFCCEECDDVVKGRIEKKKHMDKRHEGRKLNFDQV
jgi:hypothetical protein